MTHLKNRNRAVLTEGPIGKTLFALTVPMTAGIIGMIAFNLTDTFFVSRLGTRELAAIGFTYPIELVLTRFALGLSVGAASVVSRAIGRGNWEEVKRFTTDGLALSIIFVAIFIVAGLFTMDRVFGMLGATGETIPLVKQYMRIWYTGLIFVVFPMVSNNVIRATGDTRTPALIMLGAVTINIVLDPILIFGLGPFPRMGLAGAALATVIARMTMFAISFYIVYHRLRLITFRIPPMPALIDSWKKVLYISVPAAATRMILPLSQGILTSIVALSGVKAVASFGVALKIEMFSFTAVMALSSVLAAFVGQNWGAGRFDRMRRAISIGNRFAFMCGLGFFAVFALLGRPLATIFSRDPDVVSSIVLYMCIVPASYFMQGILFMVTGNLNVLNRPYHAAALGIGQAFVLTVPLAYIGRALYGLPGIFAGVAVSYLVAGAVSHKLLWRQVDAVEKETTGLAAETAVIVE